MEFRAEERGCKGATLSDKTARSEYGLTQEEIFAAIDAGKLEYRPAAMHGNPWLRVLRGEVEDLVRTWSGPGTVSDTRGTEGQLLGARLVGVTVSRYVRKTPR
jgi:hypothetical protein